MVDDVVSIPGEVKDIIHKRTFFAFLIVGFTLSTTFSLAICNVVRWATEQNILRQHDDGYRGQNEYIKKSEVLLGRENDQVLFCNAIFL